MKRLLATLALALALLPAQAADGWDKFFELSFGDLRAEAADAKKDGKLGLLIMYHFDDCPYCARMKSEVLSRPGVQAHFRKTFRAIAIDTRGSQQITGFDGRTLPENEFARTVGLRGTPTFQFYGVDGTLLATHAGAIYDPAEFMLLGDYVASGAYRTASFTVYRQSRQKRGS
ncbi:MAG: thioredoxin family protein [Betaproteobacteria bacterium]